MGVVIMRDMVMIVCVVVFCYNNVPELVVWEL